MLKEFNQENIIMLFFVVVITIVGVYVIMYRNVVDLVYLGVLGYYFGKFILVKYRR